MGADGEALLYLKCVPLKLVLKGQGILKVEKNPEKQIQILYLNSIICAQIYGNVLHKYIC